MTNKNKNKTTINTNIIKIISTSTKQGYPPKYWILTQWGIGTGQKTFNNLQIQHKLVSPGIYYADTVERSIQTYKHHLIAGFIGTDNMFPSHLWNTPIKKIKYRLNLMIVFHLYLQI